MPAKVKGILTVKQKPVERVADATVTWIKLTPEEVEAQKRFGFAADNIKVRARFVTTFTDHGLKIPAILLLQGLERHPAGDRFDLRSPIVGALAQRTWLLAALFPLSLVLLPPPSSAQAPSVILRGVWHSPQWATARTRYSSRATPEVGTDAGAVSFGAKAASQAGRNTLSNIGTEIFFG